MAEPTDPKAPPRRRTRKAAASKAPAAAKAPAAKAATTRTVKPKATTAKARKGAPRKAATISSAASGASFAESAQLARAAVNSATAAARAKMNDATSAAKAKVKEAKQSARAFDWKAQRDDITGQAGKYAKDAARTVKGKTAEGMGSLARLIDDTADTVDTKLGPQYGDYARQAASAVAGAAKSLDDKDIDQLLGEARDFVRKSPAIAIGAAAIAGYVLMRLAKGSGDDEA